MMVTPDGHGRLELSRFDSPPVESDHRIAPVNALGYLRVMFTVDDLDDTLSRPYPLGARLVDEVVDYEGVYRLCNLRASSVCSSVCSSVSPKNLGSDPPDRDHAAPRPTAFLHHSPGQRPGNRSTSILSWLKAKLMRLE